MSTIEEILYESDSSTKMSEEVKEIFYVIKIPRDQCRRINRRICYSTVSGRLINFGEATPWNKFLCDNVRTFSQIVTMILVMAIFFYKSVVLSQNARFDLDSTWLEVPESVYLTNFPIDPCACSNDVVEKNFGDQIDMSLFAFSGADLIEPIDNSTCLLYDVFSRLSTTLCCLKDFIIDKLPSNADDKL